MRYDLLTTRNPAIDADAIETNLSLFEGGERLGNRASRIIQAHSQHGAAAHAAMLRTAKDQYVDYYAQILGYYADFLFSHPITMRPTDGTANEFFGEFKEDCDGNGLDFHDFLRERFVHSLVTGRAVWVIQKPNLDIEPRNRVEWETMGGGRLTVKSFDTTGVIDWERDSSGALEWILLHDKRTVRKSIASPRSVTVETWWLYDRSDVRIFEIAYEPHNAPVPMTEVPQVQTFAHGFDRVPVVELRPHDALGDKLRAPQIAFWKASTAEAWLANNVACVVPVFFTDGDIDGIMRQAVGIKLGSDDKFEWSMPPADALKHLRQLRMDRRMDLFRSGSLRFLGDENGNSMPWRSGRSMQVDRDGGHVRLKSYGGVIREAAQATYSLLSEGRDETTRWAAEGFEHLDEFGLDDLATILKDFTAADLSKLDKVSPTFGKEFRKRVALQALPDIDEKTKDLIRLEIDAAKVEISGPDTEPAPAPFESTETESVIPPATADRTLS